MIHREGHVGAAVRFRQTGIGLVVALAAGLTLAAGTPSGYDYDQDYPDQGADWYGRSGFPDPDRDYPAFAIDLYSAGDDYAYGYSAEVAVLTLDPPLELTRDRPFEYYFRYDTTLGCSFAVPDCSDGTFCNGAELCSYRQCLPGAAPCVDSDPCTIDNCIEGTQSCSFDPPPPPGEVDSLALGLAVPASPVATLSWGSVSGAEHYNVYRGESTDLSDQSCFAAQVLATSLDDDGAIPPSGLFLYLASAFNCSQESTLGTDSTGLDRPNAAPCP